MYCWLWNHPKLVYLSNIYHSISLAMTLLLFILGLGGLIIGAEFFLKAVDRFGLKWGVSPMVMGLTVVAFATGAPELAISLKAAMNDSADLVLGNIIGSNIANILLILGITGLITPLHIKQRIVRIDVPIVIAISIGLYLLALDGVLSLSDGVLLLLALFAYSIFTYLQVRKNKVDIEELYEQEEEVQLASGTWFYVKNVGILLLGLALIVQGANWMVNSAVNIAQLLGMSELVVGLTIVSIGTSLPEVATSMAAARKGNADIAVANVLGSNIYNVLLTLGLTIVVAPGVLAVSRNALLFDMPFMIAVAIGVIPIFLAGFDLNRKDAFLFLFYYAAYLAYLVLEATGSAYLGWIEKGFFFVVLPFTLYYMFSRLIREGLTGLRSVERS